MGELVLERRGAPHQLIDCPEWLAFEDRTYECRVLICPEIGGGYSAHVIRLPGVVSQGETVEEALKNVEDAFQEIAKLYLEDEGTIPWCDSDIDKPKSALERWILVNV
jgi:predicted RNase H-like HicB family nuclease